MEFLPDEPGGERLDQQAAAEHGKVVNTKQQRHQQHQTAVNLPQAPALQLGISCDDLGSQQVLGAREQDAQDEDVNEAGLHGPPETQETTVKTPPVQPGLTDDHTQPLGSIREYLWGWWMNRRWVTAAPITADVKSLSRKSALGEKVCASFYFWSPFHSLSLIRRDYFHFCVWNRSPHSVFIVSV